MSALSRPALPPAPRYPHRQTFAAWLLALDDSLDAGAQLLRLLPLVEAAWQGADRLALHQRLWTLWPQGGEAAQAAARAQLDARHAPWCDLLGRPFPEATLALAQAHLSGGGRLAAPVDAAYVQALLADDVRPAARWLALRARLHPETAPLAPADADTAAADTLALVEAGAADPLDGLAQLFALAVRSGDAARADATLATCLGLGGAGRLSAALCLRWLAGCESPAQAPLALHRPTLRPRHLADAAERAALQQALRREAPRARLAALGEALQQPPAAPAATDHRGLGALDGAWRLAEEGRLDERTVRTLAATGALADETEAALARTLALQHLAAGRLPAAAREFATARRVAGDAPARDGLARLLRAADAHAAADVVAALLDPATDEDGRGGAHGREAAAWHALAAAEPAGPLTPIAAAMLARLHQHGKLEPDTTDRQQHLPSARRLWQALAQEPGHAEEARAALAATGAASEGLHWPAHWHAEGPGREHLLVPPSAPANGQWLIVPASLDTRHGFAQVDSLVRGLPGHHLLFVHNPEFDWYSDACFEQLCTLVRERVLRHTAREHVCCYFGSMGGTGAMKLALELGLRAVVFNPQTDLDLWAAFRPRQRPFLWRATQHASPLDWPAAAWAGAPLYLACGAHTADRLAFSALVEHWRRATDAHLIVEKFADAEHAGLIKRIARGPVPAMVASAAARLAALPTVEPRADAGWTELTPAQQATFWAALDAARATRVEIVLRAGRMWVGASAHSGTV